VLADSKGAGLNVPTAAKRGFHTLEQGFVLQRIGRLTQVDLDELTQSILLWLGLPGHP
jgi:hypothetical protein